MTALSDMTPGQWWTAGLALFLAAILFFFGLPKGSVTRSLVPGATSAETSTAGPAFPAGTTVAATDSTLPAAPEALGPISSFVAASSSPPATASRPVPPSGPAATFEGPLQAGWWWQGNVGGQLGLPTTPAPPADVPARGLLVEGGVGSSRGTADACFSLAVAPGTSCTAYGGFVFAVPAGVAAGTLRLTVHDASGIGTAPDATPATVLELCPLTSGALNAEGGGPMSDGATFSCARNVTAGPDAGGHGYTFNVGPLPASNGLLALAVLATAPTDRVVLDPLGDHALSTAPTAGG